MRKFILFVVLLLLGTSLGLYLMSGQIRDHLQEKLQKNLNAAGFTQVIVPPPALKFNQALFSDIALDDEGFSTIRYIWLTYNPVEFVLYKKLQKLSLIGLSLTGEFSQDRKLALAGWAPSGFQNENLLEQPVLLEIRDMSVNILTEEFGGVSIEIDLQARPSEDRYDIQGQISTTQKYLGFDGTLSGFVTSPDLWAFDIETTDGRIALPFLKASRTSGITKIANAIGPGITIVSKLDAGGLSLYDTPWQAASATIEYENQTVQFFLGAKSLGIEDLELSVQYQPDNEIEWTGTINAPNIDTFFEYMSAQGFDLEKNQTLDQLSALDNIYIEFAVADLESEQIKYNIKNYEKEIDIEGILEITD